MKLKTTALLMLGALVLSACDQGESPAQKAIGTALDQWAAQPNGDGSVAGEFKKDYPKAWDKIRSDAEVNYANTNDVKGARTAALLQIDTFMKAHQQDMAKASDASLDALFDERRTLLQHLYKTNIETCAHLGTGGGVGKEDDVGAFKNDVAADRRLQLSLIHEAAGHPVTHEPFAWTPSERAQIAQVYHRDYIVIPKEGMKGADYIIQCAGAADLDEIAKGFPADRKADLEADRIAKFPPASS
ncbi:MAG TPA: hypothetical protein VG407_06725 [Caulobacteraceae bacterium]|jgi:hypothetical protein|nr:hypothetical protein [Caulobacteraceae bacterium]